MLHAQNLHRIPSPLEQFLIECPNESVELCTGRLSALIDIPYDYFSRHGFTVKHGNVVPSSNARTPVRERLKHFLTSKTKKRPTTSNTRHIELSSDLVHNLSLLMSFLKLQSNITKEGIFRKHGVLSKQESLKQLMISMHLEDEMLSVLSNNFGVYNCAGVLKKILSELKLPLIPLAFHKLLRQAMQLPLWDRQVEVCQILFLLLPMDNRLILCDLLNLLKCVADHEQYNGMSMSNLSLMFGPALFHADDSLNEKVFLKQCTELYNPLAHFLIQTFPQNLMISPQLYRIFMRGPYFQKNQQQPCYHMSQATLNTTPNMSNLKSRFQVTKLKRNLPKAHPEGPAPKKYHYAPTISNLTKSSVDLWTKRMCPSNLPTMASSSSISTLASGSKRRDSFSECNFTLSSFSSSKESMISSIRGGDPIRPTKVFSPSRCPAFRDDVSSPRTPTFNYCQPPPPYLCNTKTAQVSQGQMSYVFDSPLFCDVSPKCQDSSLIF